MNAGFCRVARSMWQRALSISRTRATLAAALLVSPAAAAGQDSIPWPAGDHLTVTVSTDSARLRGDTIRLWYSVANARTSEQAAYHLAIRTLVSRYEIGGPPRWHASPGMVQDSAAALWSAVFSPPGVQPGKSRDGFWFEAVGLPTIVAFRVQGHYEPPVYNDSLPWRVQKAPSFWANSVAGFTVGIEPLPEVRDVALLLRRLQDLTQRACSELSWIRNPGVCNRLQTNLAHASQAAARRDWADMRAQLQRYLSELSAERGGTAYWLLKPNADYITH